MAKKRKGKAPRTSTPKKRPIWLKAFLAAFRETGNVLLACASAHIDRSTPYGYANIHADFAAEWAAAREDAADLLEAEARRRAHDGVRRLKFHQGDVIMVPLIECGQVVKDEAGKPILVPYVEHEYSDTLMIFLLKGARPEKFREKFDVNQNHTGTIAQVHVYLPQKEAPK